MASFEIDEGELPLDTQSSIKKGKEKKTGIQGGDFDFLSCLYEEI